MSEAQLSIDAGRVRIAKAIEVFGRRYVDIHLRAARNELGDLREDWKHALAHFVGGYAFERAGRSPYYAPAARAAVMDLAAKHRTPSREFETDLRTRWESAKGVASKGLNARNNPLAASNGSYRSVVDVIRDMKDHGHNLFAWAEASMRGSRAATAHALLRSIRGIGPKIAAFYLRDVALLSGIDPLSDDAERYLQPVDVWVQRVVDALLPHHADHAAGAVTISRHAEVCPRLFNAGSWYFGANVVEDESRLAEILRDANRFADTLKEWTAWYEGERNALLAAVEATRLRG